MDKEQKGVDQETVRSQLTNSFNNTQDVFQYFARRSKMMASVDPKRKQKHEWPYKPSFDRNKKRVVVQTIDDDQYDPFNTQHQYTTCYRQSYKLDKDRRLNKQDQLITLNNRFLMNKASDGLIPQIDQIENKRQMIDKLQQEINRDNKKTQDLYKHSQKKLNNKKNNILKSNESLNDYLMNTVRESQQMGDQKYQEAIDSISQYMRKSKFQNRHFQHLQPIDKQKMQTLNDCQQSQKEQEQQEQDDGQSQQQDWNTNDPNFKSYDELWVFIQTHKDKLQRYLDEDVDWEDVEQLSKQVNFNLDYFRYICGLYKQYLEQNREAEFMIPKKYSIYKKSYWKKNGTKQMNDINQPVSDFQQVKYQGSLTMSNFKHGFDTIQKTSYKDPNQKRDKRMDGYQNIAVHPQLIRQSQYQKSFGENMQTADTQFREKKAHTFGFPTRGGSTYRQFYRNNDDKGLTRELTNTCVPMNFVKSQLLDQTENKWSYDDKSRTIQNYPNQKGEMIDNLTLFRQKVDGHFNSQNSQVFVEHDKQRVKQSGFRGLVYD